MRTPGCVCLLAGLRLGLLSLARLLAALSAQVLTSFTLEVWCSLSRCRGTVALTLRTLARWRPLPEVLKHCCVCAAAPESSRHDGTHKVQESATQTVLAACQALGRTTAAACRKAAAQGLQSLALTASRGLTPAQVSGPTKLRLAVRSPAVCSTDCAWPLQPSCCAT